MIQDLTIYYEKCEPYCGSNDCPSTEPYYRHITNPICVSNCGTDYIDLINKICVSDCPDGFT